MHISFFHFNRTTYFRFKPEISFSIYFWKWFSARARASSTRCKPSWKNQLNQSLTLLPNQEIRREKLESHSQVQCQYFKTLHLLSFILCLFNGNKYDDILLYFILRVRKAWTFIINTSQELLADFLHFLNYWEKDFQSIVFFIIEWTELSNFNK